MFFNSQTIFNHFSTFNRIDITLKSSTLIVLLSSAFLELALIHAF